MNALLFAALTAPAPLDFSPLTVWKEVEWRATDGRMAVWMWPSDPQLKPKFVRYLAPAVASSTFHAGHDCPACGRSQYVVNGYNRDGTHNHTCPACSTTWRH